MGHPRPTLRPRAEIQSLAGRVDLLAGGPPCQGFSYVGRRCPDDPRNFLFEAYISLVDLLRPRFLLVENVLGFQSDFPVPARTGTTNFARALRRRLSHKYHLSTAVLRAHVFGVPQTRPRFFLVGSAKNFFAQADIDPFFDDLAFAAKDFLASRNLPPTPTAGAAIGDLEIGRNGTVPSADTRGFRAIAYKAPKSAYQRAMRDGHSGPRRIPVSRAIAPTFVTVCVHHPYR